MLISSDFGDPDATYETLYLTARSDHTWAVSNQGVYQITVPDLMQDRDKTTGTLNI